jgi:hypothetical protein
MKNPRIVAAFALLWVLSGCASSAVPTNAHARVQEFPRPGPLENDPKLILLRISIRDGQIEFASLDEPDLQDEIHVGMNEITMASGNHLLKATQLEWNFGETSVTLKDSDVVFTSQLAGAAASTITYAPEKNFIKVMNDGLWQASVKENLVQIDSASGRIVGYCQLKHSTHEP